MNGEKYRILGGVGFFLAGIGLFLTGILSAVGFALTFIYFYYSSKEFSSRLIRYLGPTFSSLAASGLISYREAYFLLLSGRILERGGMIAKSVGSAIVSYAPYFYAISELGWALAFPSGILICILAYFFAKKRASVLFPISSAFYLAGIIGMWHFPIFIIVVSGSLLSSGIAIINAKEVREI